MTRQTAALPQTTPTGALSALETRVLAAADTSLQRGLALKRWLDGALQSNTFDQRFDLTRTGYRNAESFGFFGRAPMEDGTMLPVMGNVQEMFYDQMRELRHHPPAVHSLNRQLREFVLQYFMRVSSFIQPQPAAPDIAGPTSTKLDEADLDGFGYTQYFCKSAEDGRILRFPPEERFKMTDLRELGSLYRWTLGMVRFWNFRMGVNLPGKLAPGASVDIPTHSYIMIPPEFVIDRENPEPGVVGEYGVGYAGILDPYPTFISFGPGHFVAAIQLFRWRLHTSGEIRIRMEFVSNTLSHCTQLTVDPVDWAMRLGNAATLGLAAPIFRPLENAWEAVPKPAFTFDPVFDFIDGLNRVTRGLAARDWSISREQFDKNLLLKHFQEHYTAIMGSALTWREVQDWLDESKIPQWVVKGKPE